ncbi:hypothetical protein C8F01DRAFT_282240 [Mycena amicta]|nr:hypothetical protein C8F01DRAFT_282240 [Mycena amicta]
MTPSSSDGDDKASHDTRSLRRCLAEIDAELDDLRARMVALAAARKSTVNLLRAVVYPILTLPPELTLEIFLHIAKAASAKSIPAIYRLARVCMTWRHIVLGSPRLWAFISTSMYQWPRESSSDVVKQHIQFSLERSGTLPLDIRLPVHAISIVPMVTEYAARWQSFECDMDSPQVIQQLGNLTGRLPALRSLSLLRDQLDDPATMPPLITAFANAPLLRSVYLCEVSPQWVSLPWAQLTKLSLCSHNASIALQIFQLTPFLESLTIAGPICFESTELDVTLSHVRELKLEEADLSSLALLTLPALEDLDCAIHFVHSRTYEDVDELSAFVTRSKCTLRTCRLTNIGSSAAIGVLEFMPTLHTLAIHSLTPEPASRTHSWMLAKLAKDPTFLPELRALHVTFQDPFRSAFHLLSTRGATLREVNIQEIHSFSRSRVIEECSTWLETTPKECEFRFSGYLGVDSVSTNQKAAYQNISYTLDDLHPLT